MSERRVEFRQMVLGLPQSPRDYAAVMVAATLGKLLHMDLVAAFIEDATVIDAAALPGAREFRCLERTWRPMVVSELVREVEHMASAARRRFNDAVQTRGLGMSARFARGSSAEVVSSLAMADDIIVIVEPCNPAERVTHQFTRLVEAAFGAAAAVMFVPSAIVRTTGPIVALCPGGDDASIPAALAIAAAARERLIILSAAADLASSGGWRERAAAAGVKCAVLAVTDQAADVAGLVRDLSPHGERLVVVSRDALGGAVAAELAKRRGIPVLVT
jgi:hypothetical protein